MTFIIIILGGVIVTAVLIGRRLKVDLVGKKSETGLEYFVLFGSLVAFFVVAAIILSFFAE